MGFVSVFVLTQIWVSSWTRCVQCPLPTSLFFCWKNRKYPDRCVSFLVQKQLWAFLRKYGYQELPFSLWGFFLSCLPWLKRAVAAVHLSSLRCCCDYIPSRKIAVTAKPWRLLLVEVSTSVQCSQRPPPSPANSPFTSVLFPARFETIFLQVSSDLFLTQIMACSLLLFTFAFLPRSAPWLLAVRQCPRLALAGGSADANGAQVQLRSHARLLKHLLSAGSGF